MSDRPSRGRMIAHRYGIAYARYTGISTGVLAARIGRIRSKAEEPSPSEVGNGDAFAEGCEAVLLS